MHRVLCFVYGLASYAAFFVTILYAIGFMANLAVPKGIDDGPVESPARSILINLLLLGAFAIQHTIMARPGFKRWWTTIVPRPIERSTFVLVASALLMIMFWQWRPLLGTVWHVDTSIVRYFLLGLSMVGWAIVFYSSFLIDHFELFGLRQVYLHLCGRPYEHRGFVTPALYRIVRNPLMLGFVIAFWSTPDMTQGHLLFAIATTFYILVGIHFEERDIARILGEPYQQYRRQTPMLLPTPLRRNARTEP
jgi:protein-S-isoprenylcysteine O-methyltransferase Ste14